jgi:hypothetical protein
MNFYDIYSKFKSEFNVVPGDLPAADKAAGGGPSLAPDLAGRSAGSPFGGAFGSALWDNPFKNAIGCKARMADTAWRPQWLPKFGVFQSNTVVSR